MCTVYGALIYEVDAAGVKKTNAMLRHIANAAARRGRDGRGYYVHNGSNGYLMRSTSRIESDRNQDIYPRIQANGERTTAVLLGNYRAEPTTEYVLDKTAADQQPYQLDDRVIVHNGTIANDAALRTYELETRIDSAAIVEAWSGADYASFKQMVPKLKGSYAILAHSTVTQEDPAVYAAVNYRPLYYVQTAFGYLFASCDSMLPADAGVPQALPPYSVAVFNRQGVSVDSLYAQPPYSAARFSRQDLSIDTLYASPVRPRALVVCSGGLDSTVAATKLKHDGYDVTLLHLTYGSRAEGPEVRAVNAVARALDVPVVLQHLPIYDPSMSNLLQADSTIAGGEAGAEFAHEWVPARNLVMVAVATALAEAHGFNVIALGNNLEEAGAYPDNEPEFYKRLNGLLPFAVGDGYQLEIVQPVGDLMKHEIVAMGLRLGAPLHETWSCYRNGTLHCGTCGPCFMRRTAFKINKAKEVIQYAID